MNDLGEIKEIDLVEGFTIPFKKGCNLISYLQSESIQAFYRYLRECEQIGYCLGGELVFKEDEDLHHLMISLIRNQDEILVMNLNEPQKTLKVLEDIIRINDEITTQIRLTYRKSDQQSQLDQYLRDLSLLNSELVNTQRELSKKNSELERLNVVLRRMSMLDFLTEIPNRRQFFYDIYEFVKTEDYLLIMLDFNFFKKVNDTRGHEYGDQVLRKFAKRIQEVANTCLGQAYRLGGDEFAILVPSNQNFDHKKQHLEWNRYLKALHPDISIAYGVEIITRELVNEENKAEVMMAKVDLQMYEHKFQEKRRQ